MVSTFMRMVVFIGFRVGIGLLLGILIAFSSMHHDKGCKKIVEQGFKNIFGLFFDCHVEATVHSFQLLVPSPYIAATNVRVTPRRGTGWEWEAERLVLSVSWFDILFGSKIGVKTDLYSFKVRSLFEGTKICIMDYIKKILGGKKDLPFEMRAIKIRKGDCSMRDELGQCVVSCAFDCEVGNFNKRLQSIVYIAGCTASYGGRTIFADAGLRFSSDSAAINPITLFSGMFYVPAIDASMPCYMQGVWKGQQGSLQISTKADNLSLDLSLRQLPGNSLPFSADLRIPLAYIQKCITPDRTLALQGDSSIQLQGNLGEPCRVAATMRATNIAMQGHVLGEIEAEAEYNCRNCNGTFACLSQTMGNPSGAWQWSNDQKKGTFQISNRSAIEQLPFKYLHIAPSDMVVTGTIDGSLSLSAQYACHIAHAKLDTTHSIAGDARINSSEIQIEGAIDSFDYFLKTTWLHNFYVKKLLLEREKKNILFFNAQDGSSFEARVSYDELRSLLKKCVNFDIQGQGTIGIKGFFEDKTMLADVHMNDGNIRLGSTHNFIKNCLGRVAFNKEMHTVSLKNYVINLHRGRLLIPYARYMYNDQMHPTYCYIPIHMQNVFLNSERDLFIVASGRVVILYREGQKPLIKGNLLIDRGQLRHNIFSAREQKSVLKALSQTLLGSSQDVEFDITIKAQRPLHVQTGFLETEIKLQLAILGSLQHPQVSGNVSITDGRFNFPYRPLYISYGRLYIMPHNLDDPAIELQAQGKLKRYTVNMYVHGTVRDPHIRFVSTPPLSQEQIITLLLAGSETGSLSFVMPSLVMQNVQNLIFGSEQLSPHFGKFMLSPLRYIRIVPSFTDQAGRGGFRGAIEIDVTDNLRAVIQKNFSLSEDTRIEVDYQVSDEISLRGLKDERGDIGGELEMRLTF